MKKCLSGIAYTIAMLVKVSANKSVLFCKCSFTSITVRVPTRQENWKSQGIWVVRESRVKVKGKYFFGKVRENEKLVPPQAKMHQMW